MKVKSQSSICFMQSLNPLSLLYCIIKNICFRNDHWKPTCSTKPSTQQSFIHALLHNRCIVILCPTMINSTINHHKLRFKSPSCVWDELAGSAGRPKKGQQKNNAKPMLMADNKILNEFQSLYFYTYSSRLVFMVFFIFLLCAFLLTPERQSLLHKKD